MLVLFPLRHTPTLTHTADSDLYKKGVLCPNEAEMRAYYVLLDLSSPTPPYYDVRPDIYSTPEMQFAIKVTYCGPQAVDYGREVC